ncbi:alkyl/aryl-sulfatase [Shewanella sp. NIFS-20-20]|uniref:alkyl/aryl-sulfatase n=1 Tax=Shewanella sp. NIFS-20-20 TaxID=2853806 RepID=UPI001C49046D|nr:alkyl sulfatase dimerization domain-containing protein [Shewanella sp. NIFS-20-20]MBV7316522.1 MBL fold metallo-hydrolase [Shewanella sp. NIFS-20-20]
MKISTITAIIISSLSWQALANSHGAGQDEHALTTSFMYQGKPATAATKAYNQAFAQGLNFEDNQAFIEGRAQLIAPLDAATSALLADAYQFIGDTVPDTINPSLYRQAQMNNEAYGLYQVNDKIFQIRGTDLANMSLVRSDHGWIVFDPLTTREAAKASLAFALKHLPYGNNDPVVGMVYSHSHADHFGGSRGVQDMFPDVTVYGSADITKEMVDENVLAGNVMSRRTSYQYGATMVPSDTTIVDAALSNGIAKGEITYVLPDHEVNQQDKFEVVTIDGLEVIFMDASGTEAVSESVAYIPSLKTIWAAEVTYKGMHNVYTLRGAKVRDALKWSKEINNMLQQWGGEAQFLFSAHSSPIWGNDDIVDFLKLQRDNYGFVHNQSLRLANNGVVLQDIGWEIEKVLPKSIKDAWHTNGYHGTYSHNARAVYNMYLGFFDMNPANLNPLPTQAEAAKFVEYMGGADAVLTRAKADFAKGEYHFVATALNKVVTHNPSNNDARSLLADTYEQLGYQAEGAGWRNIYLSGAQELRIGRQPGALKSASADVISEMPISSLLDFLAIQIDSIKAQDYQFEINLVLPDTGEIYVVELANGNLSNAKIAKPKANVDATLTIHQADIVKLNLKQITLTELLKSKAATIKGDDAFLTIIPKVMVPFDPAFEIVPLPSGEVIEANRAKFMQPPKPIAHNNRLHGHD